jgi:hypothetical protein
MVQSPLDGVEIKPPRPPVTSPQGPGNGPAQCKFCGAGLKGFRTCEVCGKYNE